MEDFFRGASAKSRALYHKSIEFVRARKKKIWFVIAATIPILLFNIGFLASGSKILPGDPDYCFQLAEAFRKSVLGYHQFPMWNPWISGGIPLFAHVVYGVVSIQSVFVVLLGAVFGSKVSFVIYQIIGFFGYRALFKKGFGASAYRSIALAYIPTFGTFLIHRTMSGHFPFLLTCFTPWLMLYFMQRGSRKRAWLYFALIYAVMIWASPHYTTIMSMVVIGIWFAYETTYEAIKAAKRKVWNDFKAKLKHDALFFAKAFAAVLVLAGYRLYFVFSFMGDYPRLETTSKEPFTGIYNGLYALWGPDQFNNPPSLPSGWGWAEASAYIGIGTLLCLLLVLFAQFRNWRAKRPSIFRYPLVILVALFVTFFVISMGDFGPFSPYHIISQLPVFSSMRVATRWLFWCSLVVLMILAAYKNKRFKTAINVILALTVIELFVTNVQILGNAYFLRTNQFRPPTSEFNEEFHFRSPRPEFVNDPNFYKVYPYDENLYEATRNNVGQIIAGDALVDTRQPNSTIHCGYSQGNCPFVTPNAKLVYWSPNKIVLTRQAPGPITLNMNIGKDWIVNGKAIFAKERIVNTMKPFIVNDPSNTIVIEYAPHFSPTWFLHKIGF